MPKSNASSQCNRILKVLKKRKFLPSMYIIFDMGITRPAARISDLKKLGYQITPIRIKGTNAVKYSLT